MKITYDPEVDALYIAFSDGPRDRQHTVNDDVILDLSADGTVVGMEILDATSNYGRSVLDFNLSLLGAPVKSDHVEYITRKEWNNT